MSAQPFRFPNQGAALVGNFFVGAGKGLFPTCLLVHGLPGDQKNLDIAAALVAAGWNAAVWSPRGSWGSGGDFTIAGIRDDLAALVAFLRESDWPIDWTRVALLGYSLGGAVVIQFTHAFPDLARALVLLAPVGDFRETSLSPEFAGAASPRLIGTTPESLQKMWMAEAWDHNPADLIADLDMPILLIQGEQDEIVPAYIAESLAASAANCEMILMPAVDHDFDHERSRLSAIITAWLSEQAGT